MQYDTALSLTQCSVIQLGIGLNVQCASNKEKHEIVFSLPVKRAVSQDFQFFLLHESNPPKPKSNKLKCC